MADAVIRLDGATELDLQSIDVGVAEDTIAFEVEGVIRGVDDGVLDDLRGKSAVPTEIHFAVDD